MCSAGLRNHKLGEAWTALMKTLFSTCQLKHRDVKECTWVKVVTSILLDPRQLFILLPSQLLAIPHIALVSKEMVSSENNKALRSFEWFPGAKLKCASQHRCNHCVLVVGIQMSRIMSLTTTTMAP